MRGVLPGFASTRDGVEAADILQLEDGKFVAHWGVSDSMAMMGQLAAGKPN